MERSAVEMQNPLAGWKNGDDSRMLSATPTTTQTLAPAASICTGDNAGVFTCYQKYYASLVKQRGVKAAFTDLRARYGNDGYIVSWCHPITHVIGNAAVAKYPTVSQAYTQGDSFCWSGYYHGVLEEFVAKIGQDKIASQLNTICADIPGKETYSFDYYNCVHGIGHGLMAMTDDELFDSLRICDNLTGGWEKTSCYGGVFMENVIVDNKNHFTKYLKPAEPLYPCTAVDEPYKNACYLMQTSYMLKVANQDFAKVFSLCEQADASYRGTCWQSLGRDASGHTVSNVELTKKYCLLGQTSEARSNCVIGAVKDFVSYFHSDVQAKQFCLALPPELYGLCSTTLTTYYLTL